MYKTIIVSLDGSELSEVALPYAEELAGRLGSRVTLVAVSDSAESKRYHELLTYVQKMAEATEQGAERYADKSVGEGIKVDTEVLVGNAAEEIVDYANKAGAGLIVMATQGRSGIRRWVLGNVADKVVRATDRPIALIRAKGARADIRETGILNKALVPLDSSKESETVIPYITELASRLKTVVVLLHVLSPTYHAYTPEGVAKIPYTGGEIEQLKTNALKYLADIAGGLKGNGITANTEVRVGRAAGEIIKLADETGADIVAMSTHGRSGVSRWAFGSVADKVLYAGNSPLLLVRVPEVSTD